MNNSFVLKYRPQKISELDKADIREELAKIIKSGRLPHALLFSGPRGTGKTSAARIIAKAINCEKNKPKDYEPCNKCSSCLSITAGTALDLLEIDAASNRGIDDIRDLREKVKLAPTTLEYKIYIIDEAHMLTTEAFNALLKTLEEPPEKTIFILCTTAPEKLPATIISRCQRFNFRKAADKEVVESLQRTVKGEKLQLEKGVLEIIAKNVDGSFRDGQKILDQLTSSGKKVTLEETKKLLGRIEAISPKKLLSLLVSKELKKSLQEIDRIVSEGAELTNYTQQLLERLRWGLLVKVGLDLSESPEELTTLKIDQLKILLEIFSVAANQIKTNPIPQLPLELAAVEWCENIGEKTRISLFSETRAGISSSPNHSTRSLSDQPPKNLEDSSNKNLSVDQYSSKRKSSSFNVKGDFGKIERQWQELLTQIKPQNHSVEALLKASRPLSFDHGVLTLEVFYKFHKERLEDEKCRRIFEETASQLFSQPIKLKCVLGKKNNPETTAKTIDSQPVDNDKLADSTNVDIMEMAQEIFGADIN